jgi:hypothetical protein
MIIGAFEDSLSDEEKRQVSNQDFLFRDIAWSSDNDATDWTGSPNGIEIALREFVPGTTSNYKRIYRDTKYQVERWIAGTIVQHKQPAMALVTLGTTGSDHWVVIDGCLLSKDPGLGPNAETIPSDTQILGFCIHNPMLPCDDSVRGKHFQTDSDNSGGQCSSVDPLSVAQFVPIDEWRHHYTFKDIATFQGEVFIALVYGRLDITPPGPEMLNEAEVDEPGGDSDIGTAEAKKRAIDGLRTLKLIGETLEESIDPWKSALGEEFDHLPDPSTSAKAYDDLADAYLVDRAKVRLHSIETDGIHERFNPYYLVLIHTHKVIGEAKDNTAIAVTVDAYNGNILETMALPNPQDNVLCVPSADEVRNYLSSKATPDGTALVIRRVESDEVEFGLDSWRSRIVILTLSQPFGGTQIASVVATVPNADKPKPDEPNDNSEVDPKLVWRPLSESSSRFFPFYQFNLDGEEVHVRIDADIRPAEAPSNPPAVFIGLHPLTLSKRPNQLRFARSYRPR